MAQRILEYRDTLPDQLSSTISSLLASQRPVLPTHLVQPESGPTQDLVRPVELENTALVIIEEPEEAEKIKLLKQKIASNASTMPTLLKRMREYMGRIDKLESSNGVIHPAFKRKRTN
ncbi:hypothetical protein ACJIZ3_016108 [Penstemon smallii]|uniref:Uncharacterized protein n=1 Tax=Penstemon smallii TaxID=265156 RepID=A0ABD3RPI3_9LAMI